MDETKIEEVKTNGNGNSTAVASPTRQQVFKDILAKHKDQIAQALPKHIRADHFIRTVITAVSKTPKLLECTQASLMGSLLTAAQLGLNPDGVLGEAYLIPFKNTKKINGEWQTTLEAQFIPGYRGLVQLALRSGIVSSFQAREVYANDVFEYEFGLDPKLKHIPSMDDKRGELKYVYAVCKYTNGGSAFDIMTMGEVEMIRLKSKAPESPAWRDFYPEMAKKTVIRKLSKMCPLSPEFNKAVGLDEMAEFLGSQKNDREVMNYDVDPAIRVEAEDAITEDVKEEEQAETTAKEDAKSDKTQAAVQATLDEMKAKEEKKEPVKKEAPPETPVAEPIPILHSLYAMYSERISSAKNVAEVNVVAEEIDKDMNIGLKDTGDLKKIMTARRKKLGGGQ